MLYRELAVGLKVEREVGLAIALEKAPLKVTFQGFFILWIHYAEENTHLIWKRGTKESQNIVSTCNDSPTVRKGYIKLVDIANAANRRLNYSKNNEKVELSF